MVLFALGIIIGLLINPTKAYLFVSKTDKDDKKLAKTPKGKTSFFSPIDFKETFNNAHNISELVDNISELLD